jgi:PKD repeat protein
VEIQEPRVENIVKAGAWFEYTDDLAPGVKRHQQDGYDSFDSWVTRIVRDAAGNIIHEDTFVSHYKKLDAITLVGRYPGDPPDGTLVRPEDYHPGGNPPPPPTGGELAANFKAVQTGGFTIVFSNTSSGDVNSCAWDFGDGGTSGNCNPTHDFGAAGSYSVTLTVTSSDGSTSSKTKTTNVSDTAPPAELPRASFKIEQLADPGNYNFIAKAGGGDEWVWDFGDGSGEHGQTANHNYAAPGDYPVTLTVSNANGSKSVTHTVHYEAAPEDPPPG